MAQDVRTMHASKVQHSISHTSPGLRWAQETRAPWLSRRPVNHR